MNNLIMIIILMLSFFIFGNYGIHLFFKKRKQNLILNLNGIEYDLIEKVKAYVTGKSRISYSWRVMRADIIFYNKNITNSFTECYKLYYKFTNHFIYKH